MNHREVLKRGVIGSLLVLAATAASASDLAVDGVWKGKNYASKVKGGADKTLTLKHYGSQVTGTFTVSTGVSGSGWGTIDESRMAIYWQNTSKVCPGEYVNAYTVEDGRMSWKFSGKDCLGIEPGHGEAKRSVER